MSYDFFKSDGVTPVSVADGSINVSEFSIGLVGKNVSGYGLTIAKNLVHVVENFASASQPANPTKGQLWYDSAVNILKVYNGTSYTNLVSGASGGTTVVDGDLQIAGDLLPDGIGQDIGSPAQPFDNIYANTFHGNLDGQASSALYADLAERFAADKVYEYGTVVMIGGEFEVTETTNRYSTDVFGVVSDKPGFMLNAQAGTDETHPYIAMAGRVEVKVEGAVKKGQRIVSGEIPGTGIAVDNDNLGGLSTFAVIGRALADKTTNGIGRVMVVVGAK